MSPKVSIILINFHREELTKKTLLHNLKNTGLDESEFELLITDQDTKVEWFPEFLKSLNPYYIRLNGHNEGIARSLNQMIVRARGEHIYVLGNDVFMPDNWLKISLDYALNIPRTGIVGLEGQDLILPEHTVMGLDGVERVIHCNPDERYHGSQVYGPILITRECINKIGGFAQAYHPYAFEDTDYCFRARLADLHVYYIKGLKSDHYGLHNENPEVYRLLKQEYYFSNLGEHIWRCNNYHRIGIYEKLPEPRDAITKEIVAVS